MLLIDYLESDTKDELTEKLMKLDASIMSLHNQGYYALDLLSVDIKEELTLDSFKNKLDLINSGYNEKDVITNLVDLAIIGLCLYNNITVSLNKEFKKYVIKNIDLFKNNVPEDIFNYYKELLLTYNIEYLNMYLFKLTCNNDNLILCNKQDILDNNKITRDFKLLQSNAFINILIYPALIAMIYCVICATIVILR